MRAFGNDLGEDLAQAVVDQGAGLGPARRCLGIVEQAIKLAGLVFDFLEPALAGVEQGFDLVDRGQVALGVFGLIQIGGQGFAGVG